MGLSCFGGVEILGFQEVFNICKKFQNQSKESPRKVKVPKEEFQCSPDLFIL